MNQCLGLCEPPTYLQQELLEAYARRPRTFVIVTHLIEVAFPILEKVIVIKDGL